MKKLLLLALVVVNLDASQTEASKEDKLRWPGASAALIQVFKDSPEIMAFYTEVREVRVNLPSTALPAGCSGLTVIDESSLPGERRYIASIGLGTAARLEQCLSLEIAKAIAQGRYEQGKNKGKHKELKFIQQARARLKEENDNDKGLSMDFYSAKPPVN